MKPIIISVLVTILISCTNTSNENIRSAVLYQIELYPQSTLQDIYKSFFQAEFGPEHIIADTMAAAEYLDYELQTKDSSSLLYEPIGADSSFFRVHLNAVQHGKITRDELFEAFISGSRSVDTDQIKQWSNKWHSIQKVIESMNLTLSNYRDDSIMIERILNEGHYAVHHSQIFSNKYKPHYRIIRKDLFYEKLYDKLH